MRLAALLVALVACGAIAPTSHAQSPGHASRMGFAVRDGRIVDDEPDAAKTADGTGDETDQADAGDTSDDEATARPKRPRTSSKPARACAVASTGDATIDALIQDSCARHGVDPRLVFAVVSQESGFHRQAVSPKGACGLMQLMPGTARRFGVTDIFDPRQNIDAGVRYLRLLLDMFGRRVDLALAGYNAGQGRVIREGYRVPAIRETRLYVAAITAHYRRLIGEPD